MIAAYKGISFFSRFIRWWTNSDYSHVSYLLADGSEVEAWSKGVTHEAFGVNHTKGTVVEIYDYVVPQTPDERERGDSFALAQVGKGYDWMGDLGFLLRKDIANPEKWFCSELDSAIAKAGNRQLQNLPDYKMSPVLCVCTPVLKLGQTVTL